jgi:hypothetical protein
MSKATLIKGFSQQESEEALEVLENSKIEFREMFSNPAYQSPILITSESTFSYKGLASIRSYCDYMAGNSTKGVV